MSAVPYNAVPLLMYPYGKPDYIAVVLVALDGEGETSFPELLSGY